MSHSNILVLLLVTAISLSDLALCRGALIADPIEPHDGWNLVGGAFAEFGLADIPPNAGSYFWGSTYNRPAIVGLAKQFPFFFQAGKYVLNVDAVGAAQIHTVELQEFQEFGLTGLLEAPTAATAPTTSLWNRWELTYSIDADSPSIGQQIGFSAVYSHQTGEEYMTSLDKL